MLEELRQKAREKAESLNNDPNALEKDKRFANQIVEYFSKEGGIKQVPQSIFNAVITFLGYPRNIKLADEMYEKMIEDIDRVYYFVEIDQNKQNEQY